MSIQEPTSKINNILLSLAKKINAESEPARHQATALLGILLGSWLAAATVEMGYSPIIATAMITTAVIGGVSARLVV